MTHFPARSDALRQNRGVSVDESEARACAGCGIGFVPSRPWQRQCSPRCRQRTYVEEESHPADWLLWHLIKGLFLA